MPAELPARAGGAGLLDLVDPLGLRPDEATAWLDRIVGSDRDRLIVTSIDLDHLRRTEPLDVAVDGSAAGTSPATGETLEDRLAAIWRELLGVEHVGPDDDFFDLGGHSLIAIRLMTRIKRDLGVRFDLSVVFEASTVAALAALVRAERPGIDTELGSIDGPAPVDTNRTMAPRSHLVTIGSRGEGRPLYVVHGAGGNVLFLSTLTRALGGERPIFGFQAMGTNDGEIPDPSIEVMASRYVAEIRAHAPGPYLLGGYSGGGIVALEMSRQLIEAGESVEHVILFDSVPPRTPWPSWRVRWGRLAGSRRAERARRVLPVREAEHEAVAASGATGAGRSTARARGAGARARLRRRWHRFRQPLLLLHGRGRRSLRARRGTTSTSPILKADHVWPVHRDDYYWRDHVAGRLEWHSVPGDHHSMFYPEYAPALADVVRTGVAPCRASAADRPATSRSTSAQRATPARIDAIRPAFDAGVVVGTGEPQRCLAVRAAQRLVGDQTTERSGERVDVAGRHQLAGLALPHDLVDRADVRRQQREPGRSSLGEHHRQAVAEGRQGEHVGQVVLLDQRRAVGGEAAVDDDAGLLVDDGSGDEVQLDVGQFVVGTAGDGSPRSAGRHPCAGGRRRRTGRAPGDPRPNPVRPGGPTGRRRRRER